MSAPLVPSPLDYVGRRPFTLYPAIKNTEPNEWVLGAGSRSEVQVVNSRTGAEMWIPRQYIAGVSDTNGPFLIVGLTKELTYRAGSLEPRVKRVIEMPSADEQPAKPFTALPRTSGPAPVIGIRIETREESSLNKAIVTLTIGALVVSFLAVLMSELAQV